MEEKTPEKAKRRPAQKISPQERLMEKALINCLKAMTPEKVSEAPLKDVITAINSLVELQRGFDRGEGMETSKNDLTAGEILKAIRNLQLEEGKCTVDGSREN